MVRAPCWLEPCEASHAYLAVPVPSWLGLLAARFRSCTSGGGAALHVLPSPKLTPPARVMQLSSLLTAPTRSLSGSSRAASPRLVRTLFVLIRQTRAHSRDWRTGSVLTAPLDATPDVTSVLETGTTLGCARPSADA
eukprot:scaffold24175_cov125-Isochrysis_galbana.AAC.10